MVRRGAFLGILSSLMVFACGDGASSQGQTTDDFQGTDGGDASASDLAATDAEFLRCWVTASTDKDVLTHNDTFTCSYRLDAKIVGTNFAAVQVRTRHGVMVEKLLNASLLDGGDVVVGLVPELPPDGLAGGATVENRAYPLKVSVDVSLAGGLSTRLETEIAAPTSATKEAPSVFKGAFQFWPVEITPVLGDGTRALSLVIDPPTLSGVAGTLSATSKSMLKPDPVRLTLFAPLEGGLSGKLTAILSGGKTAVIPVKLDRAGRYTASAQGLVAK